MSAVMSVVPAFGASGFMSVVWCASTSAAEMSREEEKEARTEQDRGLEETGRSSLSTVSSSKHWFSKGVP